jgi:hypothetical protein
VQVLKDAKRPEIDKPKRRCREVVGRFGKKFSTAYIVLDLISPGQEGSLHISVSVSQVAGSLHIS